jgi:hypothetical protein
VLAQLCARAAGQRAHADAVGRLAERGLHDRRALDRGEPETTARSTPRRPRPNPTRCSTTTGASSRCAAPIRSSRSAPTASSETGLCARCTHIGPRVARGGAARSVQLLRDEVLLPRLS